MSINKLLFRKFCNLLQSPTKSLFPPTEERTPQLLVKICITDPNSLACSLAQLKRNTRHRSHKNSLTYQVPNCLGLHKIPRKSAETAATELNMLSGYPQLPDFEVAFTQSSKISYKISYKNIIRIYTRTHTHSLIG